MCITKSGPLRSKALPLLASDVIICKFEIPVSMLARLFFLVSEEFDSFDSQQDESFILMQIASSWPKYSPAAGLP